jgi:hypothetical protein
LQQTSISYVNTSINLNLNQSANREGFVFWWYVVLFLGSNIFYKELFWVRLPYLLLIRRYMSTWKRPYTYHLIRYIPSRFLLKCGHIWIYEIPTLSNLHRRVVIHGSTIKNCLSRRYSSNPRCLPFVASPEIKASAFLRSYAQFSRAYGI